MTVKRWFCLRRNYCVVFIFIACCLCYYFVLNLGIRRELDLDLTRRYIETKLQESLKSDKGTGCNIPNLDPFSPEVTKYDKILPKITCPGTDWVKCYLSECYIVPKIKKTIRNIECEYRDILFESDLKYDIGEPLVLAGDKSYTLQRSDHVKVKCSGINVKDSTPASWSGNIIGFRKNVERVAPPAGREHTYNVMIVGYDSTSRAGFIRRMPNSYQYLKEKLKLTFMEGYNIVGDGTPAALFPMLTGKTELELPESRKSIQGSGYMDVMPFVFYKLKKDGYRTAYFEDSPGIGTFQYRFNGFKRMPADHYLRAFFLEESKRKSGYCVGDTPSYGLMLNITKQFIKLDGKKFLFTFIADVTHDDFNRISTSDEDFADFLNYYANSGALKDTLLIVMGDHGSRFAKVRGTYQGKLEERLPLMGVLLPADLVAQRPDAQRHLAANARVLTTPHDLHATLLDVMDMRQHWSTHVVPGADMRRGLTWLQPISSNRSCSEAGVEAHWCACLRWAPVDAQQRAYERAARALVDKLNEITQEERSRCVPRTLVAISWVLRARANAGVLSFVSAGDADGYVGKFSDRHVTQTAETYQAKIVVGPGSGEYEATMTYDTNEDKFIIDTREISRINAYNNEPSCISLTKPHLNMFCYCKENS